MPVLSGLSVTWTIVNGALQIVAAVRLRREIRGEWLLALVGLLTLMLALWLWVQVWIAPLLTVLSVDWLTGPWAIIAGASLMVLAMRLWTNGIESSIQPGA